MGGRLAREQTQASEAAHAAEVARLEPRPAVGLEKHLAGEKRVAAREFEAPKREAAS